MWYRIIKSPRNRFVHGIKLTLKTQSIHPKFNYEQTKIRNSCDPFIGDLICLLYNNEKRLPGAKTPTSLQRHLSLIVISI
jgi:hypothetical protein